MRKLICSTLALFLVQCATVARGPMQRIRLDSKPAGASVQLADCGVGSSERAITPSTVFVNRRATRCALTFTVPEYGSRTIVLVRKGMTRRETDVASVEIMCDILAEADSLGEFVAMSALYLPLWGIGKGVDALSGATYEQDRTRIVVDLTRQPSPTGRYRLVAVNGEKLPATTWRPRNNTTCEIRTISGWLALEEGDNWRSVFTEEQSCGEEEREVPDRTAQGIFTIEGQRILLESGGYVDSAVLEGDQLSVTVRGYGFRHGQTAVYTLRLSREDE